MRDMICLAMIMGWLCSTMALLAIGQANAGNLIAGVIVIGICIIVQIIGRLS